MFCSKCGTGNPDEAKFCSKCGAELGAPAKPSGSPLAAAPAVGVFIAIALGHFLNLLGMRAFESPLAFAGNFILPLALIAGGLFLEGQRAPVRATLIVIGAVLILICFVHGLVR